jgi:hypothetical protein
MNPFLKNSRFSVLSEDITPVVHKNAKGRQTERTGQNEKIGRPMVSSEKKNVFCEKKDVAFALAKSEFPELVSIKKHIKADTTKASFVAKLKTTKKKVVSLEEIPAGWLKIDRDESDEIRITYGIGGGPCKTPPEETREDNREHQIAANVMNALVKLHKKRIEEHIELWGREDWESRFLFANPDYNYQYDDEEVEYTEEVYDYDTDEYNPL